MLIGLLKQIYRLFRNNCFRKENFDITIAIFTQFLILSWAISRFILSTAGFPPMDVPLKNDMNQCIFR